MDSDSGEFGCRLSRDLPPDVLSTIATLVDPTIGTLRLRSVCSSWRSSLSLSSSSTTSSIQFPLKVPFPTSNSLSTSFPSHVSLFLRTIYLLSPPEDSTSNGFLVKIEEIRPNTFHLLNPLSFQHLNLNHHINLLDYRIHVICKSYDFAHFDVRVRGLCRIPIKKVVVATNFFTNGDFVVLAKNDSQGLLLWRFGDDVWTEIVANGRCFDDVISYQGKFYATADQRGGLVMIDSRLKPIDMVHRLMYGCGECTHLIACDGDLYLIDRVRNGQHLEFGVFKLDEKCRFWDYELSLNDSVFFLGDDASFSVSQKIYDGIVRNAIFFLIDSPHEGYLEFIHVFDMQKRTIFPLVNSEECLKLYLPSANCFN